MKKHYLLLITFILLTSCSIFEGNGNEQFGIYSKIFGSGTVLPSDTTLIYSGTDTTIHFKPLNYSKIDSVIIDSINYGDIDSFEFKVIKDDHYISVYFSEFTSPKMKLINAKDSSFSMGSTNEFNETPLHTVTFTHDYYMDSTEVTQAKYNYIMSAAYGTLYKTPSAWTTHLGLGNLYPAYKINWFDAVLYCNALSKADNRDTVYTYTGINGIPGSIVRLYNVKIDYSKMGYRLPTEAEWEYAAKANNNYNWYWGDYDYLTYPKYNADSTEVNNNCWWKENSYDSSENIIRFSEVALKSPNNNGLYDISGNVMEWTNNLFATYSSGNQTDPTGPSTGSKRVLRGGAISDHIKPLTTTYRRNDDPFNGIARNYGFRVVRQVAPELL